MTTLAERLRNELHVSRPIQLEAADEIERLEKDKDRLRAENEDMRRTFGSHPLFQEKDAEIERLTAALHTGTAPNQPNGDTADEIKRLRAVIIRAKDALLDGQSTQQVHDMLVAAVLWRKP